MNKHAIQVNLSIYLFILYAEFLAGLTEDKHKGTYKILFIVAFLFFNCVSACANRTISFMRCNIAGFSVAYNNSS
jgi:hypothetical protein